MIGADGGGGYEPHFAAVQQRGVDGRDGADEEQFGIVHRCRGNLATVDKLRITQRRERLAHERNVGVGDNLHHGAQFNSYFSV